MSRLFNDQDSIHGEQLSTPEPVNGSRPTAVLPEPELPDLSEKANSLSFNGGSSDHFPVDHVSVNGVVVDDIDDRIGGTLSDKGNGAHSARIAADGSDAAQPNQLFPQEELSSFRSRWDAVQTSFVDEPRAAVEQADSLVANVVERIAEQFAAERERLEKQWDSGGEVDTEDLRQALKRYRAFFDRLLAF